MPAGSRETVSTKSPTAPAITIAGWSVANPSARSSGPLTNWFSPRSTWPLIRAKNLSTTFVGTQSGPCRWER